MKDDALAAADAPLPSPGQLVRRRLAAASLERAREQIAVLKAGSEFYEERPARSFTDDLEPAGIELIEVRVGGWELLTERGKLDALLVNIDWRGVSAGDKRGLLEQEVDFGRIAEGDRTAWRGAGSQAGGQPLPSPGEMIRRRREHERQR